MQFVSDKQRRAVMSRLQRVQTKGKRTWKRLSPAQQKAVQGTTVAGSVAAALRPSVSHMSPLRSAAVYPFPVLGYALPAYAGLVRKQQKDKRKITARAVAGATGLGAGAFFTERAILHTLGGVTRPLFNDPQTLGSHLRWIAGHTVPLSVLAATGFIAGRTLLNKKKGDPEIARAQKLGVAGAGVSSALGLLGKGMPWVIRKVAGRKESRILRGGKRLSMRRTLGKSPEGTAAAFANKLRDRYTWRTVGRVLGKRQMIAAGVLGFGAIPASGVYAYLRHRKKQRKQKR